MNKEQKSQLISDLTERLKNNDVVYLADVSAMTVEKSNRLRRMCFNQNISLQVVKNTLLRKAMENVEGKDFSGLFEALKGNTSIMMSETGNAPARLLKEFRKKEAKPVLKGAYIQEAIFLGEESLETLVSLKSKDELVGDIIALLQSPIKNVVGALESGKNTLAGLVKTLEERS
jgi:large subunit ribosomal protein L10|tara:strand:+ start:823 stop:1344 length:522 start_codon:yes stop_codon:yes gene_type:complete